MEKNQHWTHHWEELATQISKRSRLLVASDFDGTLAPIAATPAEAVLQSETRTVLRRLAMCAGVHLAIISGRALADVQTHVGIDHLYYVGNHGLELSGPGIEFHHPQVIKSNRAMRKTVAQLVERTSTLDGVFVEDKGATASVHWRLASENNRERLSGMVTEAVGEFPELKLTLGKCVWEFRPRDGWHKGDALANLATRVGLTLEDVLYLGDDVTDEDAFRVAGNQLTFRVGATETASAAHYRISNPSDVQSFLLCLLGLRTANASNS